MNPAHPGKVPGALDLTHRVIGASALAVGAVAVIVCAFLRWAALDEAGLGILRITGIGLRELQGFGFHYFVMPGWFTVAVGVGLLVCAALIGLGRVGASWVALAGGVAITTMGVAVTAAPSNLLLQASLLGVADPSELNEFTTRSPALIITLVLGVCVTVVSGYLGLAAGAEAPSQMRQTSVRRITVAVTIGVVLALLVVWAGWNPGPEIALGG